MTGPWKSPKTRFPHSHSAGDGYIYPEEEEQEARAFGAAPNRQATRKENHPRAGESRDPERCSQEFSGSSCIGIEVRFRAHHVLESKVDFRLISGLENAPTLPYVDINAKNNPDVVADWIMRNVPSFVGRVPHQWTEAVITKLQQAYIRSHVIREAFKKTRTKGMDFESPTRYDFVLLKEVFPLPPTAYRSPGVPPPPTMGLPRQVAPYGMS